MLAEEALVAVVPEEHPLAHRGTVDLSELAEEPFADFATGSPGRVQSDRAFRAAGLVRRVPYEASTRAADRRAGLRGTGRRPAA